MICTKSCKTHHFETCNTQSLLNEQPTNTHRKGAKPNQRHEDGSSAAPSRGSVQASQLHSGNIVNLYYQPISIIQFGGLALQCCQAKSEWRQIIKLFLFFIYSFTRIFQFAWLIEIYNIYNTSLKKYCMLSHEPRIYKIVPWPSHHFEFRPAYLPWT